MDLTLALFFLACIVVLVAVMMLNTQPTRDMLHAIAEERPLPRVRKRASLPHLLFVLTAIPLLPLGLRLQRDQATIVFAGIVAAPVVAMLLRRRREHRAHEDVRRAEVAAASMDIGEAIRILDTAIDQHGRTAPRLTALARWQGHQGKWNTAANNLDDALLLEPDYRPARLWKIEALRHLDRLPDGYAIAEEMIETDREDWDAYIARCLLMLDRGDFVAALEQYRQISRCLPRWYRQQMPEIASGWWEECAERIGRELDRSAPQDFSDASLAYVSNVASVEGTDDDY